MNAATPEDIYAFRQAMTECSRAVQKRPPLDEADFTFYWRKLEDVHVDIVVAALDALSKEQNYFPTVARIRERADKIILQRRDAAWKDALQDCPHAHHWIELTDAAGVARLKRCDCWETATRDAAAIGARLQLAPPPPLALTEGGE